MVQVYIGCVKVDFNFIVMAIIIIESVSVEALSLTILSVDVVLLTDRGQNVDNYIVSKLVFECIFSFLYIYIYIHLQVVLVGANYNFNETIPSSHELMIKNLMLRIGQKFTIIVTATNIVGSILIKLHCK